MNMKTGSLFAGALWLGSSLMAGSAQAHPLANPGLIVPSAIEQVQYTREQTRVINRCMRQKYGPRAGRMRSPLRFFMIQACT